MAVKKSSIEYKLGQLIHDTRVEQFEMKLDVLSEKTGVSTNTLSNLENGKIKKPTVDTYERLCAELNLTAADVCKALGQPYEEMALSSGVTVLDPESIVLLQQQLQKGGSPALEKTAELFSLTTGKSNFDKELITYLWENKKSVRLEFLPYQIEQETIFYTYLKGGALHYYADICTYFNYLIQGKSRKEILDQTKMPATAIETLTDPTPSLERRFFITHIARLNAVVGQGEFLPMVFNAQQLRRRIQLDPFISSAIIAYRQLQQKEPSLALDWLKSLLPVINRF